MIKAKLGDCLKILPTLAENSIDSIVTDPPYGLKFMGKAWDFGVPGSLYWKEVLRVAKPGAHLLAFGGTRMFHRLMCAIEDAGWEIRDTIMWVYSSGFPKSHDVGKAIDKAGEPEFFDAIRTFLRKALVTSGKKLSDINTAFGFATNGSGMAGHWFANVSQQTLPTKAQWFKLKEILGFSEQMDGSFIACVTPHSRPVIGQHPNPAASIYGSKTPSSAALTAPATEAAKKWDGWGTALKPAWEPILLCRKPLEGTIAENIQKYGTGALNIGQSRIHVSSEDSTHAKKLHTKGGFGHAGAQVYTDSKGASAYAPTKGRWPANLVHDGSPEVTSKMPNNAARFFYCSKASKPDRNGGLPKDQPNQHPTVKPTELMRYLCKLITHPKGIILDPFMGSGSTGRAAILDGFSFVGIELEQESYQTAVARLKHALTQRK